jgi:hypothetical protein
MIAPFDDDWEFTCSGGCGVVGCDGVGDGGAVYELFDAVITSRSTQVKTMLRMKVEVPEW